MLHKRDKFMMNKYNEKYSRIVNIVWYFFTTPFII